MNPILTRVKKLLDLAANSGATEGERDNALRMAHAMLAKHNLDMADLTFSLQQEGREETMNITYGMGWCKDVSFFIAKLFMCKYYFGGKTNSTKCQHYFVGKSSNAATAALMAEYVIASILKQCRIHWKHNLAPESRSFAIGATRVIGERVNELIKSAKPEGSDVTSLVVVAMYESENQANEDFIKGAGTKLVKIQPKTHVGLIGSAYVAGKSFGETVGLNGQVVNKNQLRIAN